MLLRNCLRQAGSAMLLLLVGLAGLVMAVSVGLLRGEDQARTNRADVDRSAYLRDAAARLARWYEVNSATTGAQAGQIDMGQALAGAGVTPRYGLQSASSMRLSDGLVSWHVMALWLPEPIRVQGTAFDVATGVLTPGTLISTGQPADLVSAIVNGHASQLVAFTESSRRVRRVAARLENLFAARRSMDPFGPAGRDWFRALDCAAVQTGELPCYDVYTDMAATTAPAQAGIEATLTVNAWGLPINLSNLQDSSVVPPYSMAVNTTTPWGGVVGAVAQEP